MDVNLFCNDCEEMWRREQDAQWGAPADRWETSRISWDVCVSVSGMCAGMTEIQMSIE